MSQTALTWLAEYLFNEEGYEIPSYIRKSSDSVASQVGPESLCDVLNCLNNAVLAGADFMQAVRQIEMHTAGSDRAEFVVRISVQEGIASEQVWVIVLDWLIDRLKNTVTPCRQAARLLREQLRTADAAVRASIINEMASYFDHC